jgi:hypothetical protein
MTTLINVSPLGTNKNSGAIRLNAGPQDKAPTDLNANLRSSMLQNRRECQNMIHEVSAFPGAHPLNH